MSPKFINACNAAIDWLTEAREGTDQHERGVELRKAMNDQIASDMLRSRKRPAAIRNAEAAQEGK